MKIWILCLLVVGLAAFPSCSSKKKATLSSIKPFEATIEPSNSSGALIGMGESFTPRFSPDGSKLYFSAIRSMQMNSQQIFVMDLSKRLVRRLSFQDGRISSIAPSVDGHKILFSSDTEQNKQFAVALHQYQKKGLSPTQGQVFALDLKTSTIQQLTFEPGLQARPQAINDEVVFSWKMGADPEKLYVLKQNRLRTILPSKKSQLLPLVAEGKTLYWVEAESESGPWQVYRSSDLRKSEPVVKLKKFFADWAVSPKQNLMAFAFGDGAQIVYWDLKENCAKSQVLSNGLSPLSVDVNSASPQIVYTAKAPPQNNNQIFLTELKPSACLQESPFLQ